MSYREHRHSSSYGYPKPRRSGGGNMGKRKKPMGINQYLHGIGAYEKCTSKERQQMRKTYKKIDSEVRKALKGS